MIFKHTIRIRVGALVVENGKVLLVSHKKEGHVYWLLPGGGVDYGEKLPDALRREVCEELNVEIDVGDVALIFESIEPNGGRHILNIVFNCRLETKNIQIGDEPRLNSYQFFLPDEIMKIRMFPAVNDEIAGLLSGKLETVYREKAWVLL